MAELKCPRCAVGIELTQPFCAKCGLALSTKSRGGFGKVIKGVVYTVLSLVGIVFIVGVFAPQTQQAVATPSSPEPAARDVHATQLAAAYERNGVSADAQFKGQALRVTGKVTAIGTDLFNHAVITLDGAVNPFLQPSATLKESERSRAGSISAGQKVVLLCTGAGDVVKAPMLKDCKFAN